MGSSFQEHIARVPKVKTDLNFDARFESYGILQISKHGLNVFTHVRVGALQLLFLFSIHICSHRFIFPNID